MQAPVSDLSNALLGRLGALQAFIEKYEAEKRKAGRLDFGLANPNEPPSAELTSPLVIATVDRSPDAYDYTENDPAAQNVAKESLDKYLGMTFDHKDIFLTNGAFGALSVALRAILDRGDEVIYVTPSWFFYAPMIMCAGGTPVPVQMDLAPLDLDPDKIKAKLTKKTRAVIINSPHNPTGKVFSKQTLKRLSHHLTTCSEDNQRTVYLLSDEAYRRLVFGKYPAPPFPSPAKYYDSTLVVYTYSKQFLAPAQRLGYLALAPQMPEKQKQCLRLAILVMQFVTGYAFPSGVMQRALKRLDEVCVDVEKLEQKRDRLVNGLIGAGYTVQVPEAGFYVSPEVPVPGWNDADFVELLAKKRVLCVPGSLMDYDGHFRMSLSATERMIDRAIPKLKAARLVATRLGGAPPGP